MINFSKISTIAPCNENCSFCFLNYTNTLINNYLFRNVPPEEVGEIIRSIHHQVKEFTKGELIAQSGDLYHRLLIIVKGAVVGEIIDFEGRTIRIEELRAPDTIASSFIFGDDNRLPVDITAIEDTRLLIIPRTELVKLLKKHDLILNNYLNIMANRAQHLSKTIKMLGFQTIKGKIANYLLELSKISGSHKLKLGSSHAELASRFGVARPSLTRAFREMHYTGIIEAAGRNVNIKDGSRLSELLR
jgi:CRP/FNR family transcriptional regulator, dissimilatory nitrate respiration regulator